MRPPKDRDPPAFNLPTPAAYRRSVPSFSPTEPGAKTRRLERKRLILLFGIAIALHAALLLGLWLTPPLRLKWSPSADSWVQVISLPKSQPAPPGATNSPPTHAMPPTPTTPAKRHEAESKGEGQ
ncbi:MAG: hypothetical protein JWN43_917 [Gammaproteobacteria bacterium]|nr:hypothetical protein [Gammaproteobacteria bacterium]